VIFENAHCLGMALRRLGKLQEAEEKLKKVLQLDPSDVVAAFELASIAFQDKRYQDAITVLKGFESQPLDDTTKEKIKTSIETCEKKLQNAPIELRKTS
jgi:cytochrome c-type biogenesis protein CcmH/NrfG